VLFKAALDETGKVIAVKSLCELPFSVKGAENFVRQAQYKPTILAGEKVEVTGIVTYNFVRRMVRIFVCQT
jgi:DNA/RNA endonuclease YhcR with UshA esterase domain